MAKASSWPRSAPRLRWFWSRWPRAVFFEITKASGVPWRTDAAMWAVAMLENGDLDGDAAWQRRLRAVEGLQGAAPKSGEAVQ